VLLRAADTLRSMIEDIDHSNEVDVSRHLTALQTVAAGSRPADSTPPTAAADGQQPSAAAARMEETLNLVQTFVSEAAGGAGDSPASASPCDAAVSPARAAGTAAPQDSKAPAGQPPAGPAAETNIRVSVRVLDHLMNLAGELVLARNQLLQTVAAQDRGNLDSISARLNQVTSEIQEAVMQTRLQVVETVFSKFPRLVRDLSNTLGKHCELVVEGEDVELDKSIIEAIGDPLTHLIRNAVDHGLESPEARVKAGKPPKGRILLKAFHQAGKVNLAVSDDGAGIDAARIKEEAVSRGIIVPEQAREMSDREALRLIFRPGFSTAEKLTNLSGRGVGMDVVKTNVERLGGSVDVDSQVGAGTTINITLPLTLAIIPSLIVRCEKKRFAIPQASIIELVRVKAGEAAEKLQRIKNAEVLRLRGNLLPLVRLSATLGQSSPAEPSDSRRAEKAANVNIIVVESNRLRYGLVVDTLHDSEEIVVKPLGKHIKNCRCFAGATILGDGQVALILDVGGVAAQASLAVREGKELRESSETAAETAENSQAMLLFTNDPSEQFAVPMGIISRLERIRSDQIDHVGGQELLQYRGASLPLLSLENLVKALPRPQQARLYVVVFRIGQREIGLVAPQLTDIRRVSTNIDASTFREAGVIGSLVLDGKATRLLDLIELTRAARPDWVGDAPAPAADSRQGDAPTILLAEDSSFFRKQLTSFLQDDGYKVLACEDGQVAWDVLCHSGRMCDLIVTDLEMPHLDGFELASRVRNTPAIRHLPIIAVTSLASDEDVDRGKQVGIDDYHIKLDRESLMATVAERLRSAARTSSARDR
jgi:two-component system chemotaxis sensor kinase CheA